LKSCLFNIHGLIEGLKILDNKEKNIIYFKNIENKIKKLIKNKHKKYKP